MAYPAVQQKTASQRLTSKTRRAMGTQATRTTAKKTIVATAEAKSPKSRTARGMVTVW